MIARRLQRRQFRPWAASASSAAPIIIGLCDQRAADHRAADAAGHAALGQRLEEGDGGQLQHAPRRVGTQGSVMSYRDNYLDLDPTYKDAHRPAAAAHDVRLPRQRAEACRATCTDRCGEIAKRHGREADRRRHDRRGPRSIVPYQTTHNTGGAVMGDDPKTSAVNRYLPELGRAERVRRWAPPPSRRTPATTRPARSARWPIGRWRRSATST